MGFMSWQHYCTVLQQWESAKLCGIEQRAPPIFGRAAITLGIVPHSSFVLFLSTIWQYLSGFHRWAAAEQELNVEWRANISPCSNERNPWRQLITVITYQPVRLRIRQTVGHNQCSFLVTTISHLLHALLWTSILVKKDSSLRKIVHSAHMQTHAETKYCTRVSSGDIVQKFTGANPVPSYQLDSCCCSQCIFALGNPVTLIIDLLTNSQLQKLLVCTYHCAQLCTTLVRNDMHTCHCVHSFYTSLLV